jgi:hypothetical protein
MRVIPLFEFNKSDVAALLSGRTVKIKMLDPNNDLALRVEAPLDHANGYGPHEINARPNTIAPSDLKAARENVLSHSQADNSREAEQAKNPGLCLTCRKQMGNAHHRKIHETLKHGPAKASQPTARPALRLANKRR